MDAISDLEFARRAETAGEHSLPLINPFGMTSPARWSTWIFDVVHTSSRTRR
jgi:hypothetical protein